MARLTVGELARISGTTVRTLHHYDEIGLLRASDRTQAGYRLYGEADVDRLRAILSYRELGLRLDQIAQAVDRPEASIEVLRDARRLTFLHVRGDEMRLRRWNDDAGRVDRVPLFDLSGAWAEETLDPGASPLEPEAPRQSGEHSWLPSAEGDEDGE